MSNYAIFSVIGIEIEYMIVHKDTLDITPKSDQIIQQIAGELQNEIELNDICLSNELVLHVLELKNNGPQPLSAPIAEHFLSAHAILKSYLDQENLQLLPTGAHPWMNPFTETHRWPHDNHDIYAQYDKIFDCRGHGWSNLQSMHVNLPFANDEEFYQLHNTLRLLLPLLPALCASTPLLDGKPTGYLDSRLQVYAQNQKKIPSITGLMIPEFIRSRQAYEMEILKPMYQDISAYDPTKLLQHEWLNSRAAIPKFEYMALETRIIDTQECIQADIAIARLIPAILKNWLDKSHDHLSDPIATQQLKNIYDQTIQYGMQTVINPNNLKKLFQQWQLPMRALSVQEIWTHWIESATAQLDHTSQLALENILKHGNLSERILRSCNNNFKRENIKQVYQKLGECLANNQLFVN